MEAIREAGGQAAAWEADLSDAATVPALFDRVEAEFGPVDVLINNACHAAGKDTIDDLTPQTIDQTYAVNTRASLLLMTEYVRRYRRHGKSSGRIVSLSTGPAQTFDTQITYGSSKAALEASTRAIAVEVGRLGITVNVVAPGPIQTGYISTKAQAEVEADTPVGRVGRPEDIANTILFLCSDQASYLTGLVIRATGGRETL